MLLWTCILINTGANTPDFMYRIYDKSILNSGAVIWSWAISYQKPSGNLGQSPWKKTCERVLFLTKQGCRMKAKKKITITISLKL